MAVALIVAAGRGERLGSGRPKALVTLGGRSLLQWSVEALRSVAQVESIEVEPEWAHKTDEGWRGLLAALAGVLAKE